MPLLLYVFSCTASFTRCLGISFYLFTLSIFCEEVEDGVEECGNHGAWMRFEVVILLHREELAVPTATGASRAAATRRGCGGEERRTGTAPL